MSNCNPPLEKYYVIDCYRQMISLKYIREHLDEGWFRYFDTYEQAVAWHDTQFFDDSDHAVFYRNKNDEFVRMFNAGDENTRPLQY